MDIRVIIMEEVVIGMDMIRVIIMDIIRVFTIEIIIMVGVIRIMVVLENMLEEILRGVQFLETHLHLEILQDQMYHQGRLRQDQQW